MPALKSAGLIKARRGAQGGYQLAKPAKEITVYDALVALEGPLDPMMCLSAGVPADALPMSKHDKANSCLASGTCAVQEVWREMRDAIEEVLKRLTLAELLERQERRYGVPIRTYQTGVTTKVSSRAARRFKLKSSRSGAPTKISSGRRFE